MACNPHCLRFGEQAVRMGFITPTQLEAALVTQEKENQSNQHRVIGLILFDEGWLTTQQIEQILNGIFLRPEFPKKHTMTCRDN